ncbi:MAG: Bpu10I family restriction endonuclease [Edaphobacter sp.]
MCNAHLDKLTAALKNEKLPAADRPRLEAAIGRYTKWVAAIETLKESEGDFVEGAVKLLNDYRLYLDVDLIFDSPDDFLYRQKGQLKLDNSVIEEFLARLVCPASIPELTGIDMQTGPRSSYSSLFFVSNLADPKAGGGLNVRKKDQDFALSKPLYIKTSHSAAFEPEQTETVATSITYVAAECKTNLDKTMFQEACATARDTKFAVSGASYFLLCEWLDMIPLSTAATEIDEILLLRKATRIGASVRSAFATREGRIRVRDRYKGYLEEHPFRPEVFQRFIGHIRKLFHDDAPAERDVLEQGYF